MTFAVHLSMPGYTCEYMCIPFSVIREISGQLITTVSLAHNIQLGGFYVWSSVYGPPPNTHTPHPKWCMKLQNVNLAVKDGHNPFHSQSHTEAEILLVRCGNRQSGNTNEYSSHSLSTFICYNFLVGSKHKISSQQNSWRTIYNSRTLQTLDRLDHNDSHHDVETSSLSIVGC